jgi:hypothetical protein
MSEYDEVKIRVKAFDMEAKTKALGCVNALYALANPACDTPEQAKNAKIIWEAVKAALEAQGLDYASIITSQAWLRSELNRDAWM